MRVCFGVIELEKNNDGISESFIKNHLFSKRDIRDKFLYIKDMMPTLEQTGWDYGHD